AGGGGLGDGQNDPHRPGACATTGAGAGQAGPNDARPDQERGGGAAAGGGRSPPAVPAVRAGVPPQYPSLKAGSRLSREAEGGGIRTSSKSVFPRFGPILALALLGGITRDHDHVGGLDR